METINKLRFCRTKSALLSLMLIGMLLSIGISPTPAPVNRTALPPETMGQLAQHQIVISWAEGVNPDLIAKDFGARVVRKGPLNFTTLEFPGDSNLQQTIAELKNTPGVLSAEENYARTIQALAQTTAVKDPLYEKQWSLINQGVPAAWEQGGTGQGVTIACIDTGIDLDHPDLKNNLVPGYDAITESDAPGANRDNNGHGTGVAGVAAAERNDVGIVGVAYQAKIMPIKAMGAKGVGYDDDIADGILWAADHGARIINLSLGSENGANASEILKQTVAYAYDKGCLLIAATGNYDPDSQNNPGVSYPAADFRVLAVTATDKEEKVTDYSAAGAEVNLAAPGDYIPTTDWSRGEGSGYAYASGTSLAAPFVSGEAALIWGLHPDWSRDQVVEVLEQGTRDLGPPGWDSEYGFGLVDVKLALNLADQTLTKTISPARIDELGGIIEEREGSTQLALTVPQQAFAQSAQVTVSSMSVPAPLPNGAQFLTPVFQVNWGDAPLQKMLSLTWNDPGLKGDFSASIYRWNGSRWISLGGEVSDGGARLGLWLPGSYVLGTAQAGAGENQRFAGTTAEGTAIQISEKTFPTGADTVILAQVNQFPDALAGAPLAYKLQAPILLSSNTGLTDDVRGELRRLAPKTVYLLGGTAALSSQIENELKETYQVKRLYGYRAEGTARAVALELGVRGQAVLASVNYFQDALVISAWAARQGLPILLTRPQVLSEDTQTALRELKVSKSLVIGGTAVVGTKVMEELPLPSRISGMTAYDTAAAVLRAYPPATPRIELATGENYPDALTGAVRAAFYGSRVVLVPTETAIPASLASLLTSWRGNQVEALGGTAALPESVVQMVRAWVQ